MGKYQNKYRIESARAQWWDYGWNGAYFITICTAKRVHFFGEIDKGRMRLSPTGVIADILWHEIPRRVQFVELGAFVVMPNHVHGILILNRPGGDVDRKSTAAAVETLHATSLPSDAVPDDTETLHATSLQPDALPDDGEETLHATSLPDFSPPPKNQWMAAISPKSNSVSTIVRSYKSAVTRHAHRLGLAHGWQTRFHDHIIRDDPQYQRIADYIAHNPATWENDKFYSA